MEPTKWVILTMSALATLASLFFGVFFIYLGVVIAHLAIIEPISLRIIDREESSLKKGQGLDAYLQSMMAQPDKKWWEKLINNVDWYLSYITWLNAFKRS